VLTDFWVGEMLGPSFMRNSISVCTEKEIELFAHCVHGGCNVLLGSLKPAVPV